MSTKCTIAQLQTRVFAEKEKTLSLLREKAREAKARGAEIVCAGEMFCCPYETPLFPVYAEEDGGPVFRALSGIAAENKVILQPGTVPERDPEGRIYNTAYVFGPDGTLLAKHRKVHLFDVDIEGGQYFRESDTLTAGSGATVFDTPFGRAGVCVCFDIRFPALAAEMAAAGVKIVFVPAAFNMTTGPAHWQLLFRARAVDSQCFYVGTSPARDPEASYTAYGHSILTDPWGNVLSEMDGAEGMRITEIDLSEADRVRRQIPLL